jgi:hypothetical protein
VYPGVTTVELDSLAAETAASFTTLHPDYALLVGDLSADGNDVVFLELGSCAVTMTRVSLRTLSLYPANARCMPCATIYATLTTANRLWMSV